jgi:cyclohexanecarboxylate-CoA ligase
MATKIMISAQQTRLDRETVEEYRGNGWWAGATLGGLLTDAAQRFGDRVAVRQYSVSDGLRAEVSYAELKQRSDVVASALTSLGVGQGDVVAVMLPNWAEYAELIFGILDAGGIYTGVPIAYGPHEVAAILRRSKAKVLVVPERWRKNDTLRMARTLRAELPSLRTVVVLGGHEGTLEGGELDWPDFRGLAGAEPDVTVSANDLCYLGFTSGTSGEPKGAMHTHETLMIGLTTEARHLGLSADKPFRQLVGSPVGHHTGFHWGVLMNAFVGGTAVYLDRWDPGFAASLIEQEAVTGMFAAPTFFQDLLRTPLSKDSAPAFDLAVLAGAPVPRQLAQDGRDRLGVYVCPAWGMTEVGICISAAPDLGERVQATDGVAVPPSEARVVDREGRPLPSGEVGHLQVRGPHTFLGYYDRPDATAEAFDAEGWFSTGDNASIDDQGLVSLTGRTRDIIIRGGENIPVTAVESVVFTHPAVEHVAIVGYPDERLGERACAFVSLHAGETLTLPEIHEFLIGRGLSKHYLPERLEILDELPITLSGKIQKFKLRELLANA